MRYDEINRGKTERFNNKKKGQLEIKDKAVKLKHDTVLYGKQVAAEGGDGEIMDIDAHYVEPNINLYGKLLYLTEYTVQILKEKIC
jgi:Protein of unknown function (DUF3160).